MLKLTRVCWLSCLGALLLACVTARSAEPSEKPAPAPEKKADAKDNKDDDTKAKIATVPDAASKPVRITNTVTIAGQRILYTAETGMLPLLKNDGASRASVFYTAYTRLGESNPATRPVMF